MAQPAYNPNAQVINNQVIMGAPQQQFYPANVANPGYFADRMFNVDPVSMFRMAQFLRGQAPSLNSEIVQYQNGDGFDSKYSSYDAQTMTSKLYWKDMYFPPGVVDTYIKQPFQVPVPAKGAILDTLAGAFSKSSYISPDKTFKMRSLQPSLTATDANHLKMILNESLLMASAGVYQSRFVYPKTEYQYKETGSTIIGQVHSGDDAIMADATYVPPVLEESMNNTQFAKLAEILPYHDLQQSLWLHNIANGMNGLSGNDSIDVSVALRRHQLFPQRTNIGMGMYGSTEAQAQARAALAQYMRMASSQPMMRYREDINGKDIARGIASEYQAVKKQQTMLGKRLFSARFSEV